MNLYLDSSSTADILPTSCPLPGSSPDRKCCSQCSFLLGPRLLNHLPKARSHHTQLIPDPVVDPLKALCPKQNSFFSLNWHLHSHLHSRSHSPRQPGHSVRPPPWPFTSTIDMLMQDSGCVLFTPVVPALEQRLVSCRWLSEYLCGAQVGNNKCS